MSDGGKALAVLAWLASSAALSGAITGQWIGSAATIGMLVGLMLIARLLGELL